MAICFQWLSQLGAGGCMAAKKILVLSGLLQTIPYCSPYVYLV